MNKTVEKLKDTPTRAELLTIGGLIVTVLIVIFSFMHGSIRHNTDMIEASNDRFTVYLVKDAEVKSEINTKLGFLERFIEHAKKSGVPANVILTMENKDGARQNVP